MSDETVLWRRLDTPGHESARLLSKHPYWYLSGTAVFATDQPCRLDYLVECNAKWETLSGKVTGWVGERLIEIELTVDTTQRWVLNGEECAQAAGCIDLDLNFSPSTNLLPIRRLGLLPGQEATVRAAWLRFPSFKLEPLEQLYRRIDRDTYRYESAGGRFVADLKVNEVGFVTTYPNLWEAI